ncbi:MAG: four helix bundle protein [Bacteroidota bacterium]
MFDHEKLNVYKKSLEFIAWHNNLDTEGKKRVAVFEQLNRASTSITLNLAEGNGKYTDKDRCRYFDIARGSALECAAALDVLVAMQIFSVKQVIEGKRMLHEIVSMIVGLIKSNSNRLHEPAENYGKDNFT